MNWPKFLSVYIPHARNCTSVCITIALGLTVLMLVRQVPVYQSTSTLRFPNPGSNQTADSFRIAQNTRLAEMQSGLVLGHAKERVNRPTEDIRRLLLKVSAQLVPDSTIVVLKAESLDPVFAADFANAWAVAVEMHFGQNDQTRPTILDPAKPSYTPTTPRKVRTIQSAFLSGLLIGLLLALIPAAFKYKKD